MLFSSPSIPRLLYPKMTGAHCVDVNPVTRALSCVVASMHYDVLFRLAGWWLYNLAVLEGSR